MLSKFIMYSRVNEADVHVYACVFSLWESFLTVMGNLHFLQIETAKLQIKYKLNT